jgi:hypothetical protein
MSGNRVRRGEHQFCRSHVQSCRATGGCCPFPAAPKSGTPQSTPQRVDRQAFPEWWRQPTLIPEHPLREPFPALPDQAGQVRESWFRTNPSVRRVGPSHTRIRTRRSTPISWICVRWANDTDGRFHLSKKNQILWKNRHDHHNHH